MARRVIEPPTLDPVLNENAHSFSWTDYHNKSADLLNDLVDRVISPRGITDGSEAGAGVVGEVLTASGSVGLGSGGVGTVCSLTVPAGDWDVSGGVTFNITASASNHFGCGIDAMSSEIIATIPAGTGIWRLVPATVRRNVTADTAVHLIAVGFFTGTVTADGVLTARRVR